MAFDLYNFPYSRNYDGDLGYLIKVYNELLTAYKNANLDYSELQNQINTVKANLEEQTTKEDKEYKELLGKIEIIEAYLGTGAGTLQETLTKIQNDITTINNILTAYDARITNNTNDISKNVNVISALQKKTDTTNSDLTKLTERVSANESAITENTRDIETANKEIETTNARVDSLEDTLLSCYVTFAPTLSGDRYSNLNFHLFRIGIVLNFALSVNTTISETNFIELDGIKGVNYKYGLKIGEFDSTEFNEKFSNGDFITFGSCTISSYLNEVESIDDSSQFYINTPLCMISVSDLTTIYALMPNNSKTMLLDKDLSITCNGNVYMDAHSQT